MNALIKSTLREIKNSFGRYLAILVIIALGVGFFAGLRACRPALTETVGKYYEEQKMYDYRLLSSVGFSKEHVNSFFEGKEILAAEGALYEDVLIADGENDEVFRVHSITGDINTLRIVSGRLPETDYECVVDAECFSEDMIGQELCFSNTNSEKAENVFGHTTFTIVGTVTTPLYISGDRGVTSLGNGKIAGFVFINESAFTADYYKEIYVRLRGHAEAYSNDYREQIAGTKSKMTQLAEAAATHRHEKIVSDAQKEVDDTKSTLDNAAAELKTQKDIAIREAAEKMTSMGLTASLDNPYYTQALKDIDDAFASSETELSENYAKLEKAQQDVDSIKSPAVYVLTRSENTGYASFEQDSTIIENISVVFPAFFFLVAALVCVTTMTRMVDEQRTQIGVWKAMGYQKGKISCKYLFYAGSAGLVGSVLGFFAGTVFIPMIFWIAYKTSYNFADSLLFTFDPKMYALSLVIPMICTAGVTFLCCRNALREVPAAILRPKTPKNGKRILLERFKAWRRVGFLHKVSLRNVIRYKQRFFLMILGISGCTALLLTGFGIRDSIQNVTDYQYGEIALYDAKVTFSEEMNESRIKKFLQQDNLESALFLSECNADITVGSSSQSIQITTALKEDLQGFIDLHNGEDKVFYPKDGEILLCRGLAENLQVKEGETVTLTDDSFRQIAVTVSGIFDNYVDKYAFISENTMTEFNGETPINAAYVCFQENADIHRAASGLLGNSIVNHVSLNEDMRETIEDSFASLNIVVLLIILCAGVLAFIVLFNLININIGERIREIATIKVLGFSSSESAAYVFREVNILTAAGALLGLGFGRFLHAFVMAQIKTDGICFDSRILWHSYLLSLVVTAIFALLVKLAMRYKLKKIRMAESLKSVE